jgi:hypothetical protein
MRTLLVNIEERNKFLLIPIKVKVETNVCPDGLI